MKRIFLSVDRASSSSGSDQPHSGQFPAGLSFNLP